MNIKQIYNLLSFITRTPRPIYVHYGITHRCNLNCKMCKVKEDSFERELSVTEIELLTEKLAKLGISYISIGGGEPLLREDIIDVVKLFKKNEIRVRILTNGLLLKEDVIRKLKKVGVEDISISLDTLNPEKYQYITGKNKLSNVIDSIKLASQYFKGILLLNCVVSRLNYQEIFDVLSFAQKYNFLLSIIPIENPSAEFKFRNEDFKPLKKLFGFLSQNKYVFNGVEFLNYSLNYLLGNFQNFPCFAGKLYFSINPKGEIWVCHKYRTVTENCEGCMRPCWRQIDLIYSSYSEFLNLGSKILNHQIKRLWNR